MKPQSSYLILRPRRLSSRDDEVLHMAIDDMSVSDVPPERGSNRSLGPGPAVAKDLPLATRFDKPLALTNVIHSLPGRVRLRVPALKTGSQLAKGLQALLSDQTGVIEATVNTGCHSVTVVYDLALWNSDSLRWFLETRTREELERSASAAALAEDVPATGLSSMDWLQPWRFLNKTDDSPDSKGALQTGEQAKSGYWTAGYVSMVVGAILVPVPLIPGIPLLILASYFFAKASMSKAGDGPEVE